MTSGLNGRIYRPKVSRILNKSKLKEESEMKMNFKVGDVVHSDKFNTDVKVTAINTFSGTFSGTVLKSGFWQKGKHSHGWNAGVFKKLNEEIKIEKIPKTFAEFRDSKKRMTAGLAAYFLPTDEFESDIVLTYANDYYIEEYSNKSSNLSIEYRLVIGRCEFASKHLDELEAKLWLFLCEENDLFEEEIKIRNRYEIFEKNWYF